MDILYIIIPAYNESANIEHVLADWYPVIEKHNGAGASRLVIINDGSRDDTYALVRKSMEKHPMLLAVTQENAGHGAAILRGYKYALSKNADFIFQTDSDGQTLPGEFEDFWNLRKKCDMAIGWRRNREDGAGRIFVTHVLKAVIRVMFHVSVRDANTPYRLIKAETLKKYMHLIPERYFLTNVLISVIFVKKGCKVRFLPITFRPRQGGVNSINIRKIMRTGINALYDFRVLNAKIERE